MGQFSFSRGNFVGGSHRIPGVGGLGLWILASPWVLGFEHTASMRINLAVGILGVYLAALRLWLIHYGPQERMTAGARELEPGGGSPVLEEGLIRNP